MHVDLELHGGGDEDVALGAEELVARDRDALVVTGDAARLLHMGGERDGVETGRVADGARVVADRDAEGAGLRQQHGGMRADVAVALHREPSAVEREVLLFGPLVDGIDHALAGRLVAAHRAARTERLAGDDTAHGVLVLGARAVHVGVHHPDHGLGVGAHVGGGDVILGADVGAEVVGEAAGDPLELRLRVVLGVDPDAALGAAEGDIEQCALVGHERGERLYLGQRHMVAVADAALVGPQDVVVLDAVAGEELDRAVIHADGEVDDDLVLGLAQDEPHALGRRDLLERRAELVEVDLKKVQFVAARVLAHVRPRLRFAPRRDWFATCHGGAFYGACRSQARNPHRCSMAHT